MPGGTPFHLFQESRALSRFGPGGGLFRAHQSAGGQAGLLSDEHFTVDDTLIEVWASLKSFRPKDAPPPEGGGGRNPEMDFFGERSAWGA